ncbi:hypothetical protein EPI10_029076 [Gossypium australe]|uniref:Reverse transcriptase n=1 Tax=Gossypium australe TaxID=47621 RepID=A0A5B6V0M6_9ROSI|nr:hypothetical protein EPI10_029076 [Gossypium australe]
MRRIGFCKEWLNLVMQYVRTVEYTILFNGLQGEKFKPTRGLRQRDPLSVRVGRSNLSVTHLFFADDSILFGEASLEGANAIKALIYFSNNVQNNCKD